MPTGPAGFTVTMHETPVTTSIVVNHTGLVIIRDPRDPIEPVSPPTGIHDASNFHFNPLNSTTLIDLSNHANGDPTYDLAVPSLPAVPQFRAISILPVPLDVGEQDEFPDVEWPVVEYTPHPHQQPHQQEQEQL